jgi:hypothetical protein
MGGQYMKKKLLIVLAAIVLVIGTSISVFKYYHPTYHTYNDRFVIGSTPEQIVERYGEFHNVWYDTMGNVSGATYMIHDNTPELIMGYDDSLWYDIDFDDGIAVSVKLREGWIGG